MIYVNLLVWLPPEGSNHLDKSVILKVTEIRAGMKLAIYGQYWSNLWARHGRTTFVEALKVV